MVYDSLWDELATDTNRFAVQFIEKNPNSPTVSKWFPTTSDELKAYFASCVLMAQVKKPNLQSYWTIRKSLHTPFFAEVPYFPVNNAHLMYNVHPVFSILTNFFNRYRAPENTWNRTTGCGHARI
jgi:hypothetical protein